MSIDFEKLNEAVTESEANWAKIYQMAGVKLAGEPIAHAKGVRCYVPLQLQKGGCPPEGNPSAEVMQDDGTFVVYNESTFKPRYAAFEALGKIRGTGSVEAAQWVSELVGAGTVDRAPESPANERGPEKGPGPFSTALVDLAGPTTDVFTADVTQLASKKPGLYPAAFAAGEGILTGGYAEPSETYAARVLDAVKKKQPKPAQRFTRAIIFQAHAYADDEWTPCGTQIMRSDCGMIAVGGGNTAKTKTEKGSRDGIIFGGPAAALDRFPTVIKTEGPGDCVALHGLLWLGDPEPAIRAMAITNLTGCGAFPYGSVPAFKDKDIVIIHDLDKPGQAGARRLMLNLAGRVRSIKNVELPFALEEHHGNDLRDWVAQGGTRLQLQGVIHNASTILTRSEATWWCCTWHIRYQNTLGILDDQPLMLALVDMAANHPKDWAEIRKYLKTEGLKMGVLDEAIKKNRPKKKKGRAAAAPVDAPTTTEFDTLLKKLKLVISDVDVVRDTRRFVLENIDTGHFGSYQPMTFTHKDLRSLIGVEVDTAIAPFGMPPADIPDGLVSFESFSLGILNAVSRIPVAGPDRVGDGLHMLKGELILVMNRKFYRLTPGEGWSKQPELVLHRRAIHRKNQAEWVDIDRLNEAMKRMAHPAPRRNLFDQVWKMTDLWHWGKDNDWMGRTAACLPTAVWLQTILPSRPHVMVTGESRSGKSTFLNLLNTLMIGRAPLTKAQTWKAVKNKWGTSSLPMSLDEVDTMAKHQRKGLFELFRATTDGTDVITSNASQGTESRLLSHLPILCGIGNAAFEETDLNRQIPLTMHKAADARDETLLPIRNRINAKDPTLQQLGYDTLASAIIMADDILRRTMLLMSGKYDPSINARAVEIRAPMWAVGSAYHSTTDEKMLAAFELHLKSLGAQKTEVDDEVSMGQRVMEAVCNRPVTVELPEGGRQTRTIRELIHGWCEKMSVKDANIFERGVLKKYGITSSISRKAGVCIIFTDDCLAGVTGLLDRTQHNCDPINRSLALTYMERVAGGFRTEIRNSAFSGRALAVPVARMLEWITPLDRGK